MKTIEINFADDNVRTHGFSKDGNIGLHEAGLDGIYNKSEIIEYIQETEGEDIQVIFEDDIPHGQYEVTIEDLEQLGWEFSPFYDDAKKALNVSDEEAKIYIHSKYNVVITVGENEGTAFRLDAGQDFGQNEPTGDDEQTIKDIMGLIKSGDIIGFISN